MIYDKRLSRRELLRGAGAAIALPFLDAMMTSCSRFAAPDGPRRLVFFSVPNGMNMEHWTPSREGTGFDLPRHLEPLAPFRGDINVLSGLSNLVTHGAGAFHSRAHAGMLTCAPVRPTTVYVGVSVDQIAARTVGDATALRSLELGTARAHDHAAVCDGDLSCVYGDHIAWATPSQPLPKADDPRAIFDALFAGGAGAGATWARRQRYRKSLLDYAAESAASTRARIGVADQRKLDEYLTAVRDLEKLIATLPAAGVSGATPPAPDAAQMPNKLAAMIDLAVLALRADVTRIVTLMHGFAFYDYAYDSFLSLPPSVKGTGHHAISHHNHDPDRLEALAVIGTWEVQQFARLLEKMKAVVEPEGTLLDTSLVLFTSDLGDGYTHESHDLPVILAGTGGGRVRTGRHIHYDDNPVADLYTVMLQSAGVNISRIGTVGTGPLPGLAD